MRQSGAEAVAELESKISKLNADIERMAPNMKAVEKFVASFAMLCHS